jgi:aminopeptidase N
MKKLLLLPLWAFSLTLSLAQADAWICKDAEDIALQEAHHHQQQVDFRNNELTGSYDLKYHRLQWRIDPAVRYISGAVTSHFVPTEANFQQIVFDLSDQLTVDSVLFHGQPVTFSQPGDQSLQINLPQLLPEGSLDSVTVFYQGVPPNSGFGSFIRTNHQGTPVLWTLSEPYGARDWWPCKQDLGDKIDSIDVFVQTATDYKVASNGVLTEIIPTGAEHIYHWRHRHPIATYLIAIAVTNYEAYSDWVALPTGDSIEVLNYVYPENLGYAQANTGVTVDYIELFNDLFGLYPFADEKYGHAQFSWGGGMEHQTMSFMYNFSEGLVAHELAHQWFGDYITCGSWEDIWLNEGFATYLEGLTKEFVIGGDAWMNWKVSRINSVTEQPGGSVRVPDTTSVGRIFNSRLSYSKGAMLLHMLRWRLGDEDFFGALQLYLLAQANGYARTSDLQAALETQSGLALDEFFADWYAGEGYPSYHLQWWPTTQGIGFLVSQSTSHASVDFFEGPLPVYVAGEGRDTLLRLEHTTNEQFFLPYLDFVPEEVIFDPDRWLLTGENLVEQIEAITHSEDPLEDSSWQVYPNPVREVLQWRWESAQPTVQQVHLINAAGQRVISAGNVGELNLTGLPAGLYWLEVFTPGQVWRRLVVKH